MKEGCTYTPISQELIHSGKEIFLFPQPGALLSRMYEEHNASEFIDTVTREHQAILQAFCKHTPPNTILLIQSDIMAGKHTDHGIELYAYTPPDAPGFSSIRLHTHEGIPIEQQTFGERVFLKDLFTNIDGHMFVDPLVAPIVKETDNVTHSPLGEGGKVLHAGKTIIVAADLWQHPLAKQHIKQLQNQGYHVGYIPHVLPDKQRSNSRSFVPDHIDGHAALLLGQNKQPFLLYAKSYAEQGNKTAEQIKNATSYIGATPIMVKDNDLPPLAFNMKQFKDTTVVLTKSARSQELIQAVSDVVGNDHIIETDIPITRIPTAYKGSIRCMCNEAPWWFITMLNPANPHPATTETKKPTRHQITGINTL